MRISLVGAIAFALCVQVCAEMARTLPPRGFLPPRPAMSNAGTIFSGTVVKVDHITQPGFPGLTQITFNVENGIRGAHRGQNLTVREWEGLWNSGERYRIGEHVFLFLYPRSKLGLTSPVGGALGRYEVDRKGRVLMNSPTTNPKSVDMRNFISAIRRSGLER